MNKQIVMITVLMGLMALPVMAEVRLSADFAGVLYECDAVPDAASPVWDRGPYTYAASDGNLLEIDVLAAGASVGWHLPGQWGADWVSPSNYTQGDAGNPWNPDIYTAGYTVEISTEVLAANAGAYGYVLYMGEAGHGGIIELQIFTDQIKTSAGVVVYAGDLTGAQHIIRLVRYPGAVDDPFASPAFMFVLVVIFGLALFLAIYFAINMITRSIHKTPSTASTSTKGSGSGSGSGSGGLLEILSR